MTAPARVADGKRVRSPGRRARVLHLITRLPVGGAQENTLLTCERLDRSRYEVVLASGPTTGPEGSLEDRVPADVPFHRIRELVRDPHLILDAIALWKILVLLARGRFDVVHTHTTKAGLLGRIAARIARVPVVVHTPHGHAFHDYLGESGSGVLKRVERWLTRWTHKIICLTEAERDDNLRYGIGPAEAFSIVHSGVDLAKFAADVPDRAARRRALGIPEAGPVVGCVARLVPVKGVDQLLEAVPAIRRSVPDATIAFVGDGPLRPSLENRARALEVADAVLFLGLRRDVPALMPLFDVVAMPSLNEGMGKAAVEAMAAGKPVVGSRISGIQNVIDDGRTGLLVPPGDPSSLADGLVRLLQNEALRRTMGAAAKASVGGYGIEAMVDAIDRLYQDLLRARAR